MELDGGLHVRRPISIEPLDVYDRRGDGHTVSRHCGTTPQVEAERLAQHPWLPATAVRVVLKRNRTYPSGFAVLTAYPVSTAAAAYPRQL
jgi:hypothetical protein